MPLAEAIVAGSIAALFAAGGPGGETFCAGDSTSIPDGGSPASVTINVPPSGAGIVDSVVVPSMSRMSGLET